MKVNIKMSSFFRRWSEKYKDHLEIEKDGYKLKMELEHGVTVSEIFKIIGFTDQVGRSFFVNRRHAELNTPLKEDDTLMILPLLGGG